MRHLVNEREPTFSVRGNWREPRAAFIEVSRMKPIYAIKLRRKSGARDALHLLGSEATVTAGRDSLLQEHDEI